MLAATGFKTQKNLIKYSLENQMRFIDRTVNHPLRYNLDCSAESADIVRAVGFSEADLQLECIKAMQKNLGNAMTFSFCYGNVIKYLWRLKLKGSNDAELEKIFSEDIRKVVWYCEYAIDLFKQTPEAERFNINKSHYQNMDSIKTWARLIYGVKNQYIA